MPFEKVTLAETQAERQACARFNYEVYVEELGYAPSGTDHERRIVWDELDTSPWSHHYYAGEIDEIRGILRMIVWPPGEIDPTMFETYSMGLFEGIETLTIMEVGRLALRPTLRGKLVFPSLARRVFEDGGLHHGVDLGFSECRPGLVPHYRRMGLRPYRADLTQTPEGLMVPMVLVMSDFEYQRAMGSLTEDLTTRIFGPGGRPPLDITPFASLLNQDRQHIEDLPDRVWAAIENDLTIGRAPPALLDGISGSDRRTIFDGGLVLKLESGANAAVEGRNEDEIYLVLEGQLEVIACGHNVAMLRAGEVFGEMAFFRETHKRSATVRAVEPCRILALSRNFLERLKVDHPNVAFAILFNLGRIVSERLARQIVQPGPFLWR
ncbi:MAG: cyclic nucleotide-binding domain-containing protein [Proteobacteria bacterium]|nr:cyclic nucleotide-binding domain-containing protein [Pseudomonadota bacterium]